MSAIYEAKPPEPIYKPEVIGHGAAIGCLCGFTGLMVMARRGR